MVACLFLAGLVAMVLTGSPDSWSAILSHTGFATAFVVDAVLVFLGECPEPHLADLPFESSSAGTTTFPLRMHSCGDGDGAFDTHADIEVIGASVR